MIRLILSIFVLLIIFMVSANANAEIIINEVMANEPVSQETLEWFELYNNSGGIESLDGYKIHIGTKIIEFESGIELESEEYRIFCRRLYTTSDPTISRGFEDYWGDNSKNWGDTYQESLILSPIEIEEYFNFTNSGASIELYDNNDILVSEFEWTSSGLDGYSWERFSFLSDVVEQSVDLIGSTPGYVNSISPVPNDLSVELQDVNRLNGLTNISILISNVGINTVSNSSLQLIEYNGDIINILEDISLPSLNPQEAYYYNNSYDNLYPYYTNMIATLSPDDRLNNNSVEFIAPGNNYPPVIITEFLANPTTILNTEWIEIYNRSDVEFNIYGWKIGDSLNTHTIVNDTFYIQPGEYLILAKDSTNFKDYYSNYNGNILEPSQWGSLNNGTDKVRLIDQYGLELDHFSYNKVHSNNQTWSRGSDILHLDDWGVSEFADGTPGEENYNVYFSPSGIYLNLTLDPEIISPDGDGIDEFTTITVEAPSDHDYILKIYDKQGREVYSFNRVRDENEWYGVNNSGGRLPIGIYIVYLEAVGFESTKKTIVIAR